MTSSNDPLRVIGFKLVRKLYGAAVELIISDKLCFIGFTNSFISAIRISKKKVISVRYQSAMMIDIEERFSVS